MTDNRECSNWIELYLDYTQESEAPEQLHFWTALSVLSGALKRQAFMARGTAYKLYPNLYTIVVGESGKIRKGAMNIGIELLETAVPDIFIMKGRMTPEGLIKNMGRTTTVETGKIKADGSPEIMIKEVSHTVIYSEELATLFGYDKMTASRLSILLTETFTCPTTYAHTTKGEGVLIVHNLYTTLLAATDPRNLKVLPEDAIGGFLGRTVFVTAKRKRKIQGWPDLGPVEMKEKLVIDLARISSLKGEFVPTTSARKFWTEWYEEFAEIEINDARLDAFHERAHDTALKIAMLLSVSVSNSLIVEEEHVRAGIKIIERQMKEFAQSMEWGSTTSYSQNRSKFLDILMRYNGLCPKRTIARAMDLTKDEIDMLVLSLEDEGRIDRVLNPKGDIIRINPDELKKIKEDK